MVRGCVAGSKGESHGTRKARSGCASPDMNSIARFETRATSTSIYVQTPHSPIPRAAIYVRFLPLRLSFHMALAAISLANN